MFEYFYNEILRKTIISFGTLFNNISIKHTNSSDDVVSVIKVPFAYGPTQKFLARLNQSPDLNKSTAITLPRMSFEMQGMIYDVSRKQNTNTKNFTNTTSGVAAQYNPVPYNFDFSLSIYVRNTEDGTQILEQILPFFTPDFTVTMKMIPEMDLNMDIPIELISVTSSDTYEGDMDSRRIQTYQLDFTVKGYLFGPINKFKYIVRDDVNLILDGAIDRAIISTQTFTGNSEFEITETQTNNNGYKP